MNFNGINNITSIFGGTGYADPKADAGSLPEQEGQNMYESPITKLYGKIKQEIEQKEEAAIYKAIEECEIVVDKGELIKALQYDRRQYEKGKADMIEKINLARKEISEKALLYSGSGNEVTQAYCDGFKASLKILDKLIESEDTEKRKPCINYEDGCEDWNGCPCVYYKAESEGNND